MRGILGLTVMAIMLTGCSASVETNLFNTSRDVEAPEARPEVAKDLVTEVESAELGQAYRGVIVHATGFAPLEGYHAPELRFRSAGPDASGLIELEFVAVAPESATVGGGTASRRLIVAQFVPQALLDQARGIRVIAAENSREIPIVRPAAVPARRPGG